MLPSGMIGMKQKVNIVNFFCGRTETLWLRLILLCKVPIWTIYGQVLGINLDELMESTSCPFIGLMKDWEPLDVVSQA